MVDHTLTSSLAGLVKLALNLRLAALLLTLLWLPTADPASGATLALLVPLARLTSLVPVLGWNRIGTWILRHPAVLLIDLLLAIAVLGTIGLDTPFGLFVLSTALVAGVLYGGAGTAVMSAALVLAYTAGAILVGEQPTMAELLGTPALVPALAAGGAAVRALLVRQHATARALAESSLNTAAAMERTRLAREMHDTLAKTLHGIALNAAAVPRLLEHAPDAAAVTAASLAETAERAAQEARELITGLRHDDLDRPLGEALADAATSWAADVGVDIETDLDPCCGLSPSARYELFCIAREALRNAHEHGGARRIDLTLRDGETVVLTLHDDGTGFEVPDDVADLTRDGHFGVVGMCERAATVGGTVDLLSVEGQGTTVTVTVPRVAAGEAAGDLPPAAAGLQPTEAAS